MIVRPSLSVGARAVYMRPVAVLGGRGGASNGGASGNGESAVDVSGGGDGESDWVSHSRGSAPTIALVAIR